MTTTRRRQMASLELQCGTGQTGRAFLPVDLVGKLDRASLQTDFEQRFVEDDDSERLALLERALTHPTITVETYPGYEMPQELHAYVRAARISEAPIFACVLASSAVVDCLAIQPPHVVFETATFQVVGDELSDASITSAIESWIRRLWPAHTIPRVLLSPWPGAAESEEAWHTVVKAFPGVASLEQGTAAEADFCPPDDLVPAKFQLPEHAA